MVGSIVLAGLVHGANQQRLQGRPMGGYSVWGYLRQALRWLKQGQTALLKVLSAGHHLSAAGDEQHAIWRLDQAWLRPCRCLPALPAVCTRGPVLVGRPHHRQYHR